MSLRSEHQLTSHNNTQCSQIHVNFFRPWGTPLPATGDGFKEKKTIASSALMPMLGSILPSLLLNRYTKKTLNMEHNISLTPTQTFGYLSRCISDSLSLTYVILILYIRISLKNLPMPRKRCLGKLDNYTYYFSFSGKYHLYWAYTRHWVRTPLLLFQTKLQK